jgi:hypothetical protein
MSSAVLVQMNGFGSSPGPGRTRRVEFEYRRHGTLAYVGAYDVHRAHLMG